MKILAIAPHPDDIDFGCSGTLAKLADEGHHIEELIVTDGSKGNKPGLDHEVLVKRRQEEQRKSASVLGVDHVRFLGEPDGEVKNTKALRRKLVRQIRNFRPDIVISMDPANRRFINRYRSHRDHREVSVAVFDAISPAAKNPAYFPDLLEEGYQPHIVDEIWFFSTHKPDKYIDISPYFEQKLQALFCHETQQLDEEAVKQRLREWAIEAADGLDDTRHAEQFRTLPI